MHPDPEDEYFLGGGDDGDDRSPRKGALIGLALVVVLVAVAIILTSLLVDTSSAARGQRTAAHKWATALIHGDDAARRRLECSQGSRSGDVLRPELAQATEVSTGGVSKLDKNRWSVPLNIDASNGSAQQPVSVTVVRESGRYVVC